MLPCGFCFKTLWLVIQELPLPHGLSAFISVVILVRIKLIYSLFTLCYIWTCIRCFVF